ncbi:MAG: glycosyltransferase family 39 protein [Alphaproteobacteria bacterium]|nr:glycosyltransferase family 39 protein [Alphaproteobacteria bacterium]MDE2109821.1 glycosyltransferase family 39 protein [Alphaproteobacteria bacterium]MDE2493505.1 glycosyltransferase family 39 protein [Alphaproteobacteria bacterium]
MSGSRAPRTFDLAVIGTALFCALGLWRVAAILGLHVPLDPNEGWNAYHAAAAMAGGPLYPGPHSYMINNYPPLSFYVVGALGRLFGDDIVAGRLVSLLSLAVVAYGIFALALHMGAKRPAAALAVLWFVGGMLAFTDYVGMDDPQLLAHAITIGGVLLLLRAPRDAPRIAGAALLFALAAFVKHNVIALPLAVTAWLAIYDRRSALRLAAFGAFALLAGLVLFHAIYGSSLLSHLVSARTYSLANLRDGFEAWLPWSFVPLAGLTALGIRYGADRYVRFCLIYAAIGIVLGVSFLGGAGVDANVMFDADIALAISVALLFDRFMPDAVAPFAAACLVLPLVAGAWANADGDWSRASYWLHPMRDEAALARQDIAFVAARRGPALCQMMSFCYWAHKPATVDVFNTGEQLKTGVRSDAQLIAMMASRRFSVIQIDPDATEPLGVRVGAAMARHYRLDHTDDNGAFYVPR